MAVLLWWVAVLGLPAFRHWWFPYGGLDPAFMAFVIPDLVFLVGGSAVVARKKLAGTPGPLASGILLGAIGYATLYTLGWTFALQAPPWGAIAMLILGAGTFWACR